VIENSLSTREKRDETNMPFIKVDMFFVVLFCSVVNSDFLCIFV
jgi:hypothetical protein